MAHPLVIDETGKRYGRLTVIARGRRPIRTLLTGDHAARWFVKCDCGRYFHTRGLNLRDGTSRSCGCASNARHEYTRRKNEVGKRYGKLVVTRYFGPSHMGAIWECACDCGGVKRAAGGDLRRGHFTHCGCQSDANRERSRAARRMERSAVGLNRACADVHRSASARGLACELSDERIRALLVQPCRYCGARPSNRTGCNGIDRVDNSAGYVEGNVVPCCKLCNFAKRHHHVDEFIAWILRAAAHLSVEGAP